MSEVILEWATHACVVFYAMVRRPLEVPSLCPSGISLPKSGGRPGEAEWEGGESTL